MGWPDIHWLARDPGWANGSHRGICFDNLMIGLFKEVCDTLSRGAQQQLAYTVTIQGGQLLLQPLPALDRSVALTFEGLVRPLSMVVGSGCIYPSVVESFAWFLYWQFGFDSTADRILPVPSGVVWAAWEKFVQVEPWENLESNPRTAPTARIRLVTYNNWFAVPHGTGGTQEKGYPPGMPNYSKHCGGIPFSQIKQLILGNTVAARPSDESV